MEMRGPVHDTRSGALGLPLWMRVNHSSRRHANARFRVIQMDNRGLMRPKQFDVHILAIVAKRDIPQGDGVWVYYSAAAAADFGTFW